MKKVSKLFLTLIIMASFLFVGVSALNNSQAFAADEEEEIVRDEIVTSEEIDPYLFHYLNQIYVREVLGNTSYASDGLLNNTNSLSIDAFKDQFVNKTLNLSVSYFKDTYNYTYAGRITDLSGLYFFNWGNLETFIVDGHNLTELNYDAFMYAPSIKKISANNNKITSVSLGSETEGAFTTLNELSLAGNQLTGIDLTYLSKLTTPEVVQPKCVLVNNKISSAANIITPKDCRMTLHLSNNLMPTVSALDFPVKDAEGVVVPTQYHYVSVLVQGSTSNLVEDEKLTVVPDVAGDWSTLNARIYTRVTEENPTAALIARAGYGATENSTTLTFEAGKYVLKHFLGDVEIIPTSLEGTVYKGLFAASDISVKPKAAGFYVVIGKGEPQEYTEAIDKNFKVYSAADEKYTVNLKINGETVEDNARFVEITKRGSYRISATLTYDGVTSDEEIITVRNSETTGIFWGIVLVIGVAVIAIATFVLIAWFRNGAVVAPIKNKGNKFEE